MSVHKLLTKESHRYGLFSLEVTMFKTLIVFLTDEYETIK